MRSKMELIHTKIRMKGQGSHELVNETKKERLKICICVINAANISITHRSDSILSLDLKALQHASANNALDTKLIYIAFVTPLYELALPQVRYCIDYIISWWMTYLEPAKSQWNYA